MVDGISIRLQSVQLFHLENQSGHVHCAISAAGIARPVGKCGIFGGVAGFRFRQRTAKRMNMVNQYVKIVPQ